MSKILLLLLAALVGVQGLNICTRNYVAKYDELPWKEPVDGPNPIPANYKGLDYSVFQVDQFDGFIIPASGQQYAMSFAGRGNISVHEQNKHFSFSLKSFSYACSGGVPSPQCAISIWGWRGDQVVGHRVITFPALEPGHRPDEFVMNSTTFDNNEPEWRGLTSVGLANARADNGGDMFAGLMIDDFKYTVERSGRRCD